MVEKTKQKTTEKKEETAGASVGTRGRVFQGIVTKKFDTRIVVEFERTVRVQKYERFAKKKTRLHAHIPANLNPHVGDVVKVRECRPLSKIVHFQLIEIVKEAAK